MLDHVMYDNVIEWHTFRLSQSQLEPCLVAMIQLNDLKTWHSRTEGYTLPFEYCFCCEMFLVLVIEVLENWTFLSLYIRVGGRYMYRKCEKLYLDIYVWQVIRDVSGISILHTFWNRWCTPLHLMPHEVCTLSTEEMEFRILINLWTVDEQVLLMHCCYS